MFVLNLRFGYGIVKLPYLFVFGVSVQSLSLSLSLSLSPTCTYFTWSSQRRLKVIFSCLLRAALAQSPACLSLSLYLSTYLSLFLSISGAFTYTYTPVQMDTLPCVHVPTPLTYTAIRSACVNENTDAQVVLLMGGTMKWGWVGSHRGKQLHNGKVYHENISNLCTETHMVINMLAHVLHI